MVNNKQGAKPKWMKTILDVKHYPMQVWVILAGVALTYYNFDLGIVVMVTGVFIWVYNRSKSPIKKKKFNKNMFKMNNSQVTFNGKTQDKKNMKKKNK